MTSILLIDDERDWLVSFRRTLLQYDVTSSDKIRTAQSEDEVFNILKQADIGSCFSGFNAWRYIRKRCTAQDQTEISPAEDNFERRLE
ncbi:MAG: hypothetical protein LRZ85_06225 [Alphaproteobacteria bacterium]|nr:hypothetical protein [Alphaproteobacteria bacterium]